MKIPNKLKIGGLEVDIEKKNDLAFVSESDPQAKIGGCEYDTLTITLAIKRKQGSVDSIFLHEIVEFINTHYNIELTHHQIELLEAGLYQAIHDNKLIF